MIIMKKLLTHLIVLTIGYISCSAPLYAQEDSVDFIVRQTGPSSYAYKITNSSNKAIKSFKIGYDYTQHENENLLLVEPLSLGSPSGWEGYTVFLEESDYLHINWHRTSDEYFILPSASLEGFTVNLPQSYDTMKTAPFTVIFKGGTRYSGRVSEAPVADFVGSPTIGISPLLVNFTDLSTCATSWSWSFGDGATSSSQGPSHSYNVQLGNSYTVSLTASNISGSNTATKTGYITVQPCPNSPARIARTGLTYNTLADALGAATSGDIIQSHALNFAESVTVNKTVTLDGGYNCDYSARIGKTIMRNLTIGTGTYTVTVDSFDLE